jgi:hypothetical protein
MIVYLTNLVCSQKIANLRKNGIEPGYFEKQNGASGHIRHFVIPGGNIIYIETLQPAVIVYQKDEYLRTACNGSDTTTVNDEVWCQPV